MQYVLNCLIALLGMTSILADEVTLESVPPVVVQTMPKAGSKDVPVTTKEIRVTFSKPMTGGSWSWTTMSKESFPKVNGKPRYLDDQRTCVLPVKLQSGKTYAIWVNTNQYTGFKDQDGRSAIPYLLVFKT